eukprot:s521_g30.t1
MTLTTYRDAECSSRAALLCVVRVNPGTMASSDRSRSPRADRVLPGFPTWRGPMGSSIRAVPPRPEPQRPNSFRPMWPPMPGPYNMSGPYSRNLGLSSTGVPAPPRSWHPGPPCPFPPTPCSSTQCYPPSQSIPATQPIPPTQLLSPSTPHHSPSPPPGGNLRPALSPCPSQRGSTPPSRPPTPASASPTQEESRVYGFDANQFWQSGATHHDCNKVNGLTFPRTIRSSAFTSKLDIEGCDPLALPLAALLYQQADNFWLRKLAHGRELYLIPTGDIATVVFGTELLWTIGGKHSQILRLTPSNVQHSAQRSTVERNLAKVDDWWQAQPDSAIDTVQRTALMMGLPASILKGNFNDTNLVKVLTVAVTMSC